MDTDIIYKKAGEYVTGLFERAHNPKLVYHNLRHTKNVVEKAAEIAGHYHLTDRDMMILEVAAWFHDTGHLFTSAAHHEEKSAELMKEFMINYTNDTELISEIEKAILSTRVPRHPANLLQQILCDADTYHFGTKEFKESNKLVKEECTLREGRIGKIDKYDWDKSALKMLESHQYYTTYCLDLLEEQKQLNMKKLKKKIEESAENNDDLLLIKKTNNLTTKGIQTMLRLTSENHLKLSDMADHKANILISVNSIIISVILGVLLRKLQEEPNLTIPTVIFLLVSVTTIVVAILATRPKLSGGTFSSQDIMNKKTNLLFFGNFHKASYEEYDTAMRKMMQDSDYLYGSLIKDIYQLGVVLGRKYKLVHLAYNIFMVGIIVSVLAFAIAALFYTSGSVPHTTISSGSPL